jgi:hypothetical protein
VNSGRLAAARAALDRGDVLVAYDRAVAVSTDDPHDLQAAYLAALALARSGALSGAAEAAALLHDRVLDAGDVSAPLREDIAALEARIAKAKALETHGSLRGQLLAEAATLYEQAADTHGGHYARVNAATLWLLSGKPARAGRLAQDAIDAACDHATRAGAERYWALASIAEGHLVRGEVDAAVDALATAALVDEANLGARAATHRQLTLICDARGVSRSVLDVLRLPVVLHYCGHLAGGPGDRWCDGAQGAALERQISDVLDRHPGTIAVGSLASGADTLVAEAVLARGGELHVVLPFAPEEFEEVSVRPSGRDWVERFHVCMTSASSVQQVCDSAYMGDDHLFEYAAQIAMGQAVNRARRLGVAVEQLALWDGRTVRGIGGTADAVTAWRRTGNPSHVVHVGSHTQPARPTPPSMHLERPVRAVLFGDLKGLSRLRDEHFPAVVDGVLARFGDVLDDLGDAVLGRNTWGDGILAVLTDAASAGHAALRFQESLEAVSLDDLGLPGDLGLRVSVHAGPILQRRDPVRGVLGWWGRELTRAARIEPRTPEGEVYATEAFAALVALEPSAGLACDYVGRVTTAKDFETIGLYRLRRHDEETAVSAPGA